VLDNYLMSERPVFQSGDTLGYGEKAAFHVALAEEGYRPGISVYVIERV